MPSATFEYLQTLFPRQLVVPAVQAGECLDLAHQTTRNKIHDGTFPLKTFVIGGKRLVKITDLAEYIERLGQEKPKRGRPPKALKLGGADQ